MKLLFTLNNGKNVGGGDYSIFKFAEYLAKRGHDITIFATRRNPYVEEIEKLKLIKFHFNGKLEVHIKGIGFLNKLWDNIYAKTVINNHIKNNPDIDFIIGYHTYSTIKANKLAKKFGIPSVSFVFETPDWMESQLKERWFEEYKGRFKRLWQETKKQLATVEIILSISNLTGHENEKWLKRKINGTIYPGMDTSIVDNINPEDKENQIIYIGRLNAYKNIDILIKAISKIKNPPKLIICGSGEERENLIALAKKLNVNCNFKGKVNEEEKWIQIKKSLFMVFPTSFEGFGMPPMEALYCEIPCICADIPILKEVYEDKVEYFRENDVQQLKKKIEFLIKNPKYRKQRSMAGRKYVKKKYGWSKSAEKIEKILINYMRKNHHEKNN